MTTTNEHTERAELKPCPFCGHTGLDFSEGSTFRWIVASCGKCGASRGETRIQTSGEGCKEQWMAEAQAEAIREWNQRAALLEAQRPIDMVLYCPKCGTQHIDAPDDRTPDWANPPHKSHLCRGCGHIWRPSDHPTNGVERTASGKDADTTPAQRPALKPLTDEQIGKMYRETQLGYGSIMLRSDYERGIRDAEAAHGIKEQA